MASDLQSRLALLRKSYVAKFPAKWELIDALHQAVLAQPDAEAFAALRLEVHKLKGSGATYGFEGISKAAQELEMLLIDLLDQKRSFDDARDALALAASALKDIMDAEHHKA